MTEKLYDIFLAARRITTDSRSAAGQLFFGLKGGRFDGSEFAPQALAGDAVCAVVSKEWLGLQPEAVRHDPRYFSVPDTLLALQELAAWHRRELGRKQREAGRDGGFPVIALTGTNGKTTTKELLTRVLGLAGRVTATEGNLNNHIGVPLTLLSMTEITEIGIVEMGANHVGEIARLCEIAAPDYGLITNIGRAHLEGFGSEQGVRRAKGELYDWLETHGGRAFYNADDPVLNEMIADRPRLAGIPYEPLDGYTSANGMLTLRREGREYPTQMSGLYNRFNASAAFHIGLRFGIAPEDMLRTIGEYRPDNSRSQVLAGQRGNTLYLDAYNANPSSMAASLEHFLSLQVSPKAIILGDMMELGEYAAAEHRAIVGQLQKETSTSKIFLVGANFTAVAAHLQDADIDVFSNTSALAVYLEKHSLEHWHILIKGSRGMALEQLLEVL